MKVVKENVEVEGREKVVRERKRGVMCHREREKEKVRGRDRSEREG